MTLYLIDAYYDLHRPTSPVIPIMPLSIIYDNRLGILYKLEEVEHGIKDQLPVL